MVIYGRSIGITLDGIFNIDIISTTSDLPTTIIENLIVLKTDINPNNIFIDMEQPQISNMNNGDIFIRVSNLYADPKPKLIISQDNNTLDIYLSKCYQLNNSAFVEIEGYIGNDNEWVKIDNDVTTDLHDLPPLHKNFACSVSNNIATITMDSIPDEYSNIYKDTLIVAKKDSAPTTPYDGEIFIIVQSDGSYIVKDTIE